MQKKILVPGSVLLDIYENSGEKRLGGASFNFAYHIWRLVGDVTFCSRVGDDETGSMLVDKLKNLGFPIDHIQYDDAYPTKTVRITFSEDNEPCFDVTKDVASERLVFPEKLSLDKYDLIYFGTTIQYAAQSRETVRTIIKNSTALKFCDINLRNNLYTAESIEYSLINSDILKINHNELDVLSELFGLEGSEEELVAQLASGFDISTVAVTMAERGSYLFDGKEFFYKHLEPSIIIDPVGAGDAYSAILVIGCLSGWSPKKILDIATDFALAVCNNKGAISEEESFYDKWSSLTT